MPNTQNIPQQKKGFETNISHSVTASSREEAMDIFKRANKRLLNINIWHKLAGTASAEFELIGPHGEETHRLAKVNDYFKIDIPGPGPQAGDGYDWVQVENIEDKTNPGSESESFSIKVRPAKNPDNKKNDTAHFFSDEATSTFIIERQGNKVTASVKGRNELPNRETESFFDKVRNFFTASGAAIGASKVQWGLLVKGLLNNEDMDAD